MASGWRPDALRDHFFGGGCGNFKISPDVGFLIVLVPFRWSQAIWLENSRPGQNSASFGIWKSQLEPKLNTNVKIRYFAGGI